MQSVGRVIKQFRYPVKSMHGEAIDVGQVNWLGLVGDREYVVVREVDGRKRQVVTAKPAHGAPLLSCSASSHPQLGCRIELSDSRFHWASQELRRRLTELLGYHVVVARRCDEDAALATNAGFDLRGGQGYDSSPLHLITDTSLKNLSMSSSVRGAADLRRYRPNLIMEADTGLTFLEDQWVGRILHIGEVVVRVRKRTERCGLPARPQEGVPALGGVLSALKQANDNHLGVYLTVIEPGEIHLGDPVLLGS